MSPSNLVLVTGATGTIGTAVVEALLEAGIPIRAAYNSPRSQAKLKELGATETVQLDMNDSASLEAAFVGVSQAFLLVPFVPTIVEQGKALIDAAQKANVNYVVRLSAIGAAPDAALLPGQWHGQLDEHLKASGLLYTIVQPNFFMQNFVTFYGETINSQNALYLPYGEAKVSWVDARDIAAVVASCFQHSEDHTGKTYLLTGSEAPTMNEVAATLSQTLERTITYYDVTEADATAAMQQQGIPEIMVQALSDLNGIAKVGYAGVISPDVATVTGRAARSFSQFVQENQSVWQAKS